MSSPTQRSKAYLESEGYTVAITEHWNQWARRRVDLFGFVDLLAIRQNETLAVQTTSGSNVSARVKKIAEHENVAAVRAAGWRIVCHGWRKNSKGRYILREIDCS
jgi:carbonic anhydrase